MEPLSVLLALCAETSPVAGECPAQRPVTRSFDVFFDLRLNKRLSKHSWGWWFETPSYPLWRHCNATVCATLSICLVLHCTPAYFSILIAPALYMYTILFDGHYVNLSILLPYKISISGMQYVGNAIYAFI